jgi:hypothetical protein
MISEMNVYSIGHIPRDNNDKCVNYYGEFTFRKSKSKNMNKLWSYFYKNKTYPEFYLGTAKKTAICKCLITGKEEWFNGERCLKVNNPIKGSIVKVELRIKNIMYNGDFIFIEWVKTPVHEWMMRSGTILQLDQKFVDGLLPEDKRYLRLNR